MNLSQNPYQRCFHRIRYISNFKTLQFRKKNFEFQNSFSQTLQFWSSHTQNSSQMKFIDHVHKQIHKNAQNSWIKHHFVSIQNFTKLSKLFNINNNFHHQFTNGIFIIPIHQQHVFKHHQHNYSWIHSKFIKPQLHYLSVFTKTQHIHTYDFWHMNSISTTLNHSIHMYKHIINN